MKRKQLKPVRKQLTREGRRRVMEAQVKYRTRYRYPEDVIKPIEPRLCSAWLIESSLGERRVLLCHKSMKIEQVVDIVKAHKWRQEFTVMVLSAGDFMLMPSDPATKLGSHFYSPDSRKVSQSMEVIL